MLVRIRDRAALARIPPIRVSDYLRSKGWATVAEEVGRYSLWSHPARVEQGELLLPLDQGLGDFVERTAELLEELQQHEQRSQLEIFYEIETSGCDFFRFRSQLPSPVFGSIPLNAGLQLVQATRDILHTSAAMEYNPTASLPASRAEEVRAFMDRAYLGQTEVSSFVVTAQIRVEPLLTMDLFSEHVYPGSEPFERRVGVRMMGELENTREAAIEAARTHDFRPFSDLLSAGVTFTLCTSIVSALETSPDQPFEVRATWAPARPLVGKATALVSFDPEVAEPLRAAINILRPTAPRPSFKIFGSVEVLERPDQKSLIGDLAIRTVIDGRPRKVLVSLVEPEFQRAIEAFRAKRPIQVTGDLIKQANRWMLRDPHDVEVMLAQEDDVPDEDIEK